MPIYARRDWIDLRSCYFIFFLIGCSIMNIMFITLHIHDFGVDVSL